MSPAAAPLASKDEIEDGSTSSEPCNSNASSSPRLQNDQQTASKPAAASEAAAQDLPEDDDQPQLKTGRPQQDDQVAECQVESVNRDNNSIIIHNTPKPLNQTASNSPGEAVVEAVSEPSSELLSSSNGNANEISKKAPVLRKLGEKTPPGTLRKLSKIDRIDSCKSWFQDYGQTFLAKTIDTPLPDPGPIDDDENSGDSEK